MVSKLLSIVVVVAVITFEVLEVVVASSLPVVIVVGRPVVVDAFVVLAVVSIGNLSVAITVDFSVVNGLTTGLVGPGEVAVTFAVSSIDVKFM